MLIPTRLAGCRLRSWQPDDQPALVREANNRKVWRNLTELFPHPYTDADAQFWVGFAQRAAPSIHLAIDFDGRAIGGIGVDVGKGLSMYTGAIGYWLGEAHWGQGIASAAACAMAAHVFAQTQLVRLEARVFAWNPASTRVLEKAGFTREGVRKSSVFKDGQLTDEIVYALVRCAP